MKKLRTKLRDLIDITLGRKLLELCFGISAESMTYLSWREFPNGETNLDDNLVIAHHVSHSIELVFRFSNGDTQTLVELDDSGYSFSKKVIKLFWGFCFGRIIVPENGFREEIRKYLLTPGNYTGAILCGRKRNCAYYYDTFQVLIVNGGKPRHEMLTKRCELVTNARLLAISGKSTYNIEEIEENNPHTDCIAFGPRSKIVGQAKVVQVIRFAGLPILN